MRRLYESRSYTVYHGTNNKFDKFKIDNQDIGWFTDDYDYAASQGMYVNKYILSPNKVIDGKLNLSDEEIADVILDYKPNMVNKIDKLVDKVQKNIKKYNSGKLGSAMYVFEGMGGVDMLKRLGYDMEKVENPYDRTSNFYIVFDEDIIKSK